MKKSIKLGLVGLAVSASFVNVQAEESLIFVSWGGAYSESQKQAYAIPFTEKTGTKIIMEDKSGEALAGIRSQVSAGNVTWNIVDMLIADAQRACDEGLIMEIPIDEWLSPAPDGTPASEDFIDGTIGNCFVASILYSTLFAYNTEMLEEGPTSIADIWDTEKFPGKRSLQKIPQKNLEWALIADGVERADVYTVLETEEGQDRAFAKLDEIKDDVIWWSEGAQPPQMLADKEVSIATAFNGRIFNAQVNEDQPFAIMWSGQMFEADGFVIPVGNEDKLEEIKSFLQFSTDTQRLADQAKYIAYGPARASSAALVSTHKATGVDMKPHMPTNPKNLEEAVAFNNDFWTNYGDVLEERFNAWLAQ